MRHTTETFVDAAKDLWEGRWEYEKSTYTTSKTPVEILCPLHGPYYQTPKEHLKKSVGCSGCNGRYVNTDIFVARSREVWGDRWGYDDSTYTKMSAPVSVTCKDHGAFQQRAQAHLLGRVGCPRCNGSITDTEEYIRRAREVWGSRWDYTELDYTGSPKKVVIICPTHGRFTQASSSHLTGTRVGCAGCNGRGPLAPLEFIRQMDRDFPGRLDFSRTKFSPENLDQVIEVRCTVHDIRFIGSARQLRKGYFGCWRCNPTSKMTEEKFKWRLIEKGIDRTYDYSQVDFSLGVFDLQQLGCSNKGHGFFKQSLDAHLAGKEGCPKCQATPRFSKGEVELGDFVESLGLSVDRNRRNLLGNGWEVDVYVPSLNLAVEYNGVYWHSEKFVSKNYHYEKYKAANSKGIRLLQVWEDDWKEKRSIVEEHLRNVMGVSKRRRVMARKTVVRVVSSLEVRGFLSKNHIQGFSPSTVYLGLDFKGELVAVASFLKKLNNFTLTRYCTSENVIGGHSKLVSWFERTYDYHQLETFADLTFSDGGLYSRTGWVEHSFLSPDYSYVKGTSRRHKFGYRKAKFKLDPSLVYSPHKTERELALDNGLLRVYDAGKLKFIKIKKVV